MNHMTAALVRSASRKMFRKKNRKREERFSEVPAHLRNVIGDRKIEILNEQFNMFDGSGVGLINSSELGMLLALTGENPIKSRLQETIDEVDANGDGLLSFAEFVVLWYRHVKDAEGEEEMFRKAFEFFDQDGDGSVRMLEFKKVVTSLGDHLTDEECQLFFEKVDTDMDGALQYDEFLSFLREDAKLHKEGLPPLSAGSTHKSLAPRAIEENRYSEKRLNAALADQVAAAGGKGAAGGVEGKVGEALIKSS